MELATIEKCHGYVAKIWIEGIAVVANIIDLKGWVRNYGTKASIAC